MCISGCLPKPSKNDSIHESRFEITCTVKYHIKIVIFTEIMFIKDCLVLIKIRINIHIYNIPNITDMYTLSPFMLWV